MVKGRTLTNAILPQPTSSYNRKIGEMSKNTDVKLISMDTIPIEEVTWLLKPFIPYGKITIIQGDPGEGKTTVALNTAVALAQEGKCTVLIDCDVRKPATIGDFRGLKPAGLVEYLNGTAELADIISQPVDNLFVINGNTTADNAAELFRTDKMAELINALREVAELIILDSPPCAILADAQVLAGYSDCAVYVVCREYTRKSSLVNGIGNLSHTGIRFIGYVLNNAQSSASGLNYGRYSRYGRYSDRYGRYGRYGKYGKYGRYGKSK